VSPTTRRLAYLVAGVVLGFLTGALVGPPMAEVAIVGDLFLLALRMVVVPLVVASLVTGVAALADTHGFGRALRVSLVYYVATMAAAVTLGLVLVTAIQPGEGIAPPAAAVPAVVEERAARPLWENVQDLLRSFVSPNVFTSLSADPPGILAVIVFSVAFGALLGTLGPTGRPVRAFFEVVDQVLSRMVTWIVRAAPVGVFALVAARLGRAGGGAAAVAELRALGLYAATVLAGLALHGGVVLPAVLALLGRRRPARFAKGMAPALVTAFATASSSATLPLTLRCVTANGVSERAARFVAPVGATVNMNGTALYEAVAAVFIAQAYGVALSGADLVLVAVSAVLAAMGAAAIPEAGLVTMVMVLSAAGLPAEGIALLLPIDWFLDRCRTAVNVWDDGVGAAVVERLAHLDVPAADVPPTDGPPGGGDAPPSPPLPDLRESERA
jgi:Na+/H+-dicarboxylate symporter